MRKRRQVLVFVNQVAHDEWTGQGGFERGLIGALRRRVASNPDEGLEIVSIRTPDGPPRAEDDGPETVRLLLDKRSRWSYVVHQWRLWFTLVRKLWRHRRDDVAIYGRHNMAMVAPPLAAICFRRPLTLRSGPLFEGYNPQQYGITPNRLTQAALVFLAGLTFRACRRVVVVSAFTGRSLVRRFPFLAPRLAVVRNGVDADRFQPQPPDRARWGLPEGVPAACYVGHIDEAHDFLGMLRAFAAIPPIEDSLPHLLVIGDGPLFEEARALARSLGIDDRCHWAGRRPGDEVPSAISSCDVMLAPALAWVLSRGGSSMVKLWEYLACGKPIVAPNVPDHEFLVRDGVGWLAEASEEADWTRVMAAALAHPHTPGDPREVALRDFTFERVARQIWDAAFGGPVETPDSAALDASPAGDAR